MPKVKETIILQNPPKTKKKQRKKKKGTTKEIIQIKTKSPKQTPDNRKIQRPRVTAFGNNLSSNGRMNAYLQQLVNPLQANVTSYPDTYEKRSHTMKGIINQNLNFIGATYSATPQGTYLVWSFPELIKPALVLNEYTIDNVLSCNCFVNSQNNNMGLYNINGSEDAEESQTMILDDAWRNVVGEWVYEDDTSYTVPQFYGYTNVVGDFYGIPGLGVGYTTSDPSGSFTVIFGNALSNTNVLHWQVVCQYGIYCFGSVAASSGALDITVPVPFIGANGCTPDVGLPGMGIQLYMVDTAVPPLITEWNVLSVSIQANVGRGLVQGQNQGQNTLRMTPVSFPDESLLIKLATNKRVICQSVMVSYQGSLLNNGGKASSYFYRGGENPGSTQLDSYDNISNRDEAYAGSLVTGSYTWWCPEDTVTMQFTPMKQPRDYIKPYIAASGLVLDTTQGPNILRLNICSHIELISTSQIFQYSDSRVDPIEIYHANATIKYLPHSMENPLHLEKIKNFLKGIASTALDVTKFVANNAPHLIPLLTAFL